MKPHELARNLEELAHFASDYVLDAGFELSVPSEPSEPVHIKGDPLGRSYTPDHVALAIVQRLRQRWAPDHLLSVVEPCAGGGAFLRAVLETGRVSYEVQAFDVSPDAPALQDQRWFGAVHDATLPFSRARAGVVWDCSVTNPPFGKAVGQAVTLGIVDRMREGSVVAAAMVPLGYLGQKGWSRRVKECAAIWPLVGRVWVHEREMMVLVWDKRVPVQQRIDTQLLEVPNA